MILTLIVNNLLHMSQNECSDYNILTETMIIPPLYNTYYHRGAVAVQEISMTDF